VLRRGHRRHLARSRCCREARAHGACSSASARARLGLEIRLVGSAEVSTNLKQLVETSDLPVFKTVEEAKAA